MQIKATMYHYAPTKIVKKKVRKFQIKAGEKVEQNELFSTIGVNVNWCNYFGKLFFSV